MASNDIRSAIGELRQILSTPMRAYDSSFDDVSSDTDVTGRRSSESDCLDDTDLPGLITRVLGKRELNSAHVLYLPCTCLCLPSFDCEGKGRYGSFN